MITITDTTLSNFSGTLGLAKTTVCYTIGHMPKPWLSQNSLGTKSLAGINLGLGQTGSLPHDNMNTRIQTLAEQAAESVIGIENELNLQVEDDDGNSIVVPATFIEKFAELLVQECVGIAEEQRDPPNLNYKPSQRFAEALKLRFGIE